jgi:hypothetical protein
MGLLGGPNTLGHHKYILLFSFLFTEQTKSVAKSSTATIAAKSKLEQIKRTFLQKNRLLQNS